MNQQELLSKDGLWVRVHNQGTDWGNKVFGGVVAARNVYGLAGYFLAQTYF